MPEPMTMASQSMVSFPVVSYQVAGFGAGRCMRITAPWPGADCSSTRAHAGVGHFQHQLAPSACARTVMWPPSTWGSSPWRMAFSTSGCSSSGGHGHVAQRSGRSSVLGQARAHAHGHQLQVVAQAVKLGLQRVQLRASR
jgi:hypothetical protein